MDKKDFFDSEDNKTFNLLKRIHIESGENTKIYKKIIISSLITWFPLLILSFIEGNALNNSITIPFLFDYAAYVKFLVTLPLFFICEKLVKHLTSESIFYFIKSGIISDNNISEYEILINKYHKFLNSGRIEFGILAFSVVYLIIRELFFKNLGIESSWKNNQMSDYTIAGYWYIFVSFPVTQFILFRMLWKFFIWVWLLWKVSMMKLNLLYTNPDKAGGLNFLGPTQLAFGILGFAQSATFSSQIATKVIYGGFSLRNFELSIVLVIPLISVLYLLPLCFFTKNLIKLKVNGLYEFGILAHKYGYLFENKWIRKSEFNQSAEEYEKDSLLGSGDIQSLADIGSSFERIMDMRLVPFSFTTFIVMILLITMPILPLATLIIPLPEILKILLGFLV
ncbi:MAG TPA: hypothetical protein PKD83_08685 [Ignavibacteria bacterium]|nr:hypothetical protein [Ignavibacteria bacterium]